MSQRCVAFGVMRSGTSMLQDALNGLEGCCVADELLTHRPRNRLKHAKSIGLGPPSPYPKNACRWLQERALPRLEELGPTIHGFKLIQTQVDWVPSVTQIFTEDVKVVVTLRNPLASYVSYLQAITDKQWRRTNKAGPVERLVQVHVDPIGFKGWLFHRQQMWETIGVMANPVKLVLYGNLVDRFQETMADVCDFLGVRWEHQPPKMSLIRPHPIKDRIANWQTIRNELAPQYHHFLDDLQ